MTVLLDRPLDPSPPEPESFRDARRLHRFVEAEMETICNSTAFKTSRKCREFLRYVVQVTLSGRADSLKERSIGIDLMGCDLSYDPSTDARVRVRAKEVRQRLTAFYAMHTGSRECRISLPLGTYVPEFVLDEKPAEAAAPSETATLADSLSKPDGLVVPNLSVLSMFCPAGIALFLFGFLLRSQVLRTSAYDEFWGELLNGKSTLTIDVNPTSPLLTESMPFVWLAGRFDLHPSIVKTQNEASAPSEDLVIHLGAETAPALVENHSTRFLMRLENGRLHARDRSTSQDAPFVSILTVIPGRPTQLWLNSVDEGAAQRMMQVMTTSELFPSKLHDMLPTNSMVQVALPSNSSTPIVVGDKVSQP